MEPNREVDVARNVGLGDITFFSQVGYGGGGGLRRRAPGRDGDRDRAVPTSRWPGGRASAPSKSSRPWAQVPQRLERPLAMEPAVRPAAPGRRGRDAHAPLHPRVRRDPRSPRERRVGVPEAREPQPGRDDAREDAHARGVHGSAMDLRAVVPLRQLPRDRRCPRGRARARGRARSISGSGPCTSTPAPRGSRPSTRR